jgi:hypothetical protein
MLEDRRNKTLEQMVDQNIVVHIEDKISKTVIALQTRQPVQSGLARLTDPFINLTHILYCRCCLCECVAYASHSSHVYSLTRSLELCVGTWVILGWCWAAVGSDVSRVRPPPVELQAALLACWPMWSQVAVVSLVDSSSIANDVTPWNRLSGWTQPGGLR